MQDPNANLRRLLSIAGFVTVVAAAFVLLGPPSAAVEVDPRIAVAPPGGTLSEPFVARPDASATEREIALRFETVRQYPDTVEAYVLLGSAYLQHVRETGDPTDLERAEAAFDAALRREPDHVDALVGKGSLALTRHDFIEALELGQRAAKLAPSAARPLGVVVDAQTELGRYDEAVATTQRMLDLRPDLASYSRVSYQRELRGDIDGAIEAMDRAFRSAAGGNVENREYLRVLIGDLHLLKGDAATAEQIQRASLEVAPDYVWALAGLARAQAAQGNLREAIDHYAMALDRLPLTEFAIALGEAQEAAGRTEDAAGSYGLVRAIGQLYEANGANVDLELSLFEADHGDAARALELAERAWANEPNVKAADALAWALHRNGRHDEAREHAEAALRLGTPYGRFLYHAGSIAAAQGDTEAARAWLTQALATDGSLSPIARRDAEAVLESLGR